MSVKKILKKCLEVFGLDKQKILYALSTFMVVITGQRGKSKKILEQYHNKYAGQRCFIVCTGPSLTIEDLNMLKNEICFSCNRIAKVFNETDWRPTFYTIFDEGVGSTKDIIEGANSFEPEMRFFREQGWYAYRKFKNPKCYIHSFWDRKYLDDPHFSEQLEDGIYTIGTVTYSMLQIARWMGFSEIYIIGADNKYRVVVDRDGNITENPLIKNYFGSANDGIQVTKENAAPTWEMDAGYNYAEKYSREHGFRIFNATRGGFLEAFERVNLDDLFKK